MMRKREFVIESWEELKEQIFILYKYLKKQVYGHNSRVYCIKFDKENPNICFTGGWDKNIIIWDFRDPTAGKQVKLKKN